MVYPSKENHNQPEGRRGLDGLLSTSIPLRCSVFHDFVENNVLCDVYQAYKAGAASLTPVSEFSK